jgi:tetratricopeptide (TPR) repeat protein
LRLQPELAEAHLAMGHYWGEGRQDDERALQSYERALRGLPNSAELHAALARLYRRQARWDDAIDAYRRALTLDPSMMNVAADLVFTYSRLRRYDEAIALIDRVIVLEPDNHSAKLSKGYMVIRRDGTPDTLAAALARIPADWDPQGMGAFARVILARAQRRPEQALAILNAAPSEWLGKGPVLRSRTLLRAQVYEQLGDTVRARADYEAIVRVLEDSAAAYPTDPRWHIALGLTYAGLGQPIAAGRAARRAMDLVPLSKDALQGSLMMAGAAEIFARAGDADVALELLDRLLSMPAGPEASVPLLRLEPMWDPLRDDPRFEQMLRRHERATTTLRGSR